MSKFYKMNGSKYAINHYFFTNITTEGRACLLGFYIADGNINEKRKTFRIGITEEDKDILEMFRINISPDSRFYYYKPYQIKGRNNKVYTGNPKWAYDVNSAKLVNSLVDLGYGYNKTYEHLHLPKLNDALLIHFIRGYFDGDGWITTWTSIEKGKSPRVRCNVGICNKHSDLLEEIKTFFEKYNIHFKLHYLKRDDMYRIVLQSKSELYLLNSILYKNSHLFMSRKKNKFDHYVNTEILHKTDGDCNA